MDMNITDPSVDQYLYSMLPARDAVLREMETLARKRSIPIIGPAVARIAYQLVRLVNAKKIFEMGSAIGYSTIWIALAAGRGATVYYTDSDPENARLASDFFDRAGVRSRIKIQVGDALEVFDRTRGSC